MKSRRKNNAIFRHLKVLFKLSVQIKNISIKIPALFSFSECLRFLNRSENECLFQVENEKIRKLFFDEKPILVELHQDNDGFLNLVFLNDSPPNNQISSIKNYIENWLDLNYDLNPFYKMAKEDKLLATLIKKYNGLRLIGIPDFYEAICWAIIGQQINLNFAYSVKRSLVERFGIMHEFMEKHYYHFPTPEKVLSITDRDFSDMKFSWQKITYIRAISKNIVDQTIDFEQLANLEYDTAKKALMALYGIGNWSADYVLMKTFRHAQAFPIQDAGLQNALKKSLELKNKPDLDTMLRLSKPWKGFEAYATFYLWRSLYD